MYTEKNGLFLGANLKKAGYFSLKNVVQLVVEEQGDGGLRKVMKLDERMKQAKNFL